MKFLALEREKPGLSPDDFIPYGKAEAARVWDLYTANIFREIYFNPDDHTAVIILEASDKDEANSILDSLPMVQAGLIRFDVIELSPYTGFSRLFRDNS